MAPRSSWKGFLKLSLVSVPVKAFTANNTSGEVRLNQLHSACNNRIRYKKVCPEHGEVGNDEIVSGYEYSKGHYVVIDPEELDKLRTENDRSVHIDGFIQADELSPIYHGGRTYYLLPDGAVGQKPYALLLKGMIDNNVSAIAQVVVAGKEQLVLVHPLDGMLTMTILNHDKKVKSADEFREEITDSTLSKEELNLTKTLIQASTLEEFDYSKYKDNYVEKLTELIQLKVEGKEVVQVPDAEEPKIINLMEALKQSVAAAVGGTPEKQPEDTADQKKMAPSARSKKKAGKTKKKIG